MELLQYTAIGDDFGGVFALIMYREPRTLWSGVIFFILMLWTLMVIGMGAVVYSDWLQRHPAAFVILILLALIVIMILALFPILLILTFLVQGIKVLKHEGMRPTNALSLLFAVGLIVYLIVWPWIGDMHFKTVGTVIYVVISWLVIYLLAIMAMYALSAILNLIHIRKQRRLDYIVVLGCGVIGDRVTPLLAGRIEKGLQLLNKKSISQNYYVRRSGTGGESSEGEAMAKYAIDKETAKERIIIENKSVNTMENLRFSKALMEKEKPKIAIVTTSYHVFRALVLAKQCGIRCVGFGARTKWYFTLNAVLREFVGYLSMTWKRHALAAGAVSAVIILVNVLDFVLKLR